MFDSDRGIEEENCGLLCFLVLGFEFEGKGIRNFGRLSLVSCGFLGGLGGGRIFFAFLDFDG